MDTIRSSSYELGLPDGWLDQTTVTMVGPIRPGVAPNITINQEPPPADMSIEQYFIAQRQELSTLERFQLVEHGDRLLGGVKALYHVYTWVSPQNVEIMQMQLMARHAGLSYTLTASCTAGDWPNFSPHFEQAIARFKFS